MTASVDRAPAGFEDAVSNAISAKALASFFPPFTLAATLAVLSRRGAAASASLLRATSVVDPPMLDDGPGSRLGALLARHVVPGAVTRLALEGEAEEVKSPTPWLRGVAGLGYTALRELVVTSCDLATFGALGGVIAANGPTLRSVSLDCEFDVNPPSRPRLAVGRALGRCGRLRALSLTARLVEWTRGVPCLPRTAALRSLTISGFCSDINPTRLISGTAAALIAEAAARGHLEYLDVSFFYLDVSLFDGFDHDEDDDEGDPSWVALQRAFTSASASVAELRVSEVRGNWTVPRLPRLRRLTTSGVPFAVDNCLLRHAPGLTMVATSCWSFGDTAAAAAAAARCRDCSAASGAALAEIRVGGLASLLQVQALGLSSRLASMSADGGTPPAVLDGSADAMRAIQALPPSVTRLTLWASVLPPSPTAIADILDAFPALQQIVVRGCRNVDDRRSYKGPPPDAFLRAAHSLQRPVPVRVAFED